MGACEHCSGYVPFRDVGRLECRVSAEPAGCQSPGDGRGEGEGGDECAALFDLGEVGSVVSFGWLGLMGLKEIRSRWKMAFEHEELR